MLKKIQAGKRERQMFFSEKKKYKKWKKKNFFYENKDHYVTQGKPLIVIKTG